MKKFEDELKNGPVMIDRDNVTGTPIYDEGTLIGHFKNWKSPEYVSKLKQRNEQLDRENLALRDKIANLEAHLNSQQPEIPEFVAEVFSDNDTFRPASKMDIISWFTGRNSDPEWDKVCLWARENEEQFIQYVLNFKPVAKEKRFYLKHKSVIIYKGDRGEPDVDELYLMADGNFAIFKEDAYKFTQSEIDSMETGSYEQLEVEK